MGVDCKVQAQRVQRVRSAPQGVATLIRAPSVPLMRLIDNMAELKTLGAAKSEPGGGRRFP